MFTYDIIAAIYEKSKALMAYEKYLKNYRNQCSFVTSQL